MPHGISAGYSGRSGGFGRQPVTIKIATIATITKGITNFFILPLSPLLRNSTGLVAGLSCTQIILFNTIYFNLSTSSASVVAK
jgi:hypothetical protein